MRHGAYSLEEEYPLKKSAVILTTAIAMAIPVCSFAAAWNVPSNVRIVQKSNTDSNGRIYSTIQAALNSITTTPDENNPVVIKVMPGLYDLGTTPIQMKPYVTLDGSGADSTILVSSVSETSGCSSTNPNVGAIRMDFGSALKNLSIRVNSTDNHVTGVSVINVPATIEGVNINAASNNGADGICFASLNTGTIYETKLNNCSIDSGANLGQANALKADGGYMKVTATQCNFSKNSVYGYGAAINMETGGVDLTVNDSTLQDVGIARADYILNTNGGTSTVKNSKFVGSCQFNATAEIPNSMKIINSEIDLASTPGCFGMDNPSLRLANNVDENGNVIANK